MDFNAELVLVCYESETSKELLNIDYEHNTLNTYI